MTHPSKKKLALKQSLFRHILMIVQHVTCRRVAVCVSKQGLLRVAIENARAQEKQDQLERTELKMELVRERELRETLERQLSMEQKNRGGFRETNHSGGL